MLKLLVFCLILINGALAKVVPKDKALIDGRIIGGNLTSIDDFPHHASIQYVGNHHCGGAIISRTWILTGAYCFSGLYTEAQYYSVRVGTSHLGVGGQRLKVNQIIRHANYSRRTHDFDIAVIELSEPITLSSSAQIIGLPDNGNDINEGTIATVTGWTYTFDEGNASDILRTVKLPVLGRSVCEDLYSSLGYVISNNMLCGGLIEGGTYSCAGDVGDPVVVGKTLIGLVSWGNDCAQPQNPGLYTNVGALRDWIKSETGI